MPYIQTQMCILIMRYKNMKCNIQKYPWTYNKLKGKGWLRAVFPAVAQYQQRGSEGIVPAWGKDPNPECKGQGQVDIVLQVKLCLGCLPSI